VKNHDIFEVYFKKKIQSSRQNKFTDFNMFLFCNDSRYRSAKYRGMSIQNGLFWALRTFKLLSGGLYFHCMNNWNNSQILPCNAGSFILQTFH